MVVVSAWPQPRVHFSLHDPQLSSSSSSSRAMTAYRMCGEVVSAVPKPIPFTVILASSPVRWACSSGALAPGGGCSSAAAEWEWRRPPTPPARLTPPWVTPEPSPLQAVPKLPRVKPGKHEGPELAEASPHP